MMSIQGMGEVTPWQPIMFMPMAVAIAFVYSLFLQYLNPLSFSARWTECSKTHSLHMWGISLWDREVAPRCSSTSLGRSGYCFCSFLVSSSVLKKYLLFNLAAELSGFCGLVSCLFVCLFVWDRASLCRPGCPQTQSPYGGLQSAGAAGVHSHAQLHTVESPLLFRPHLFAFLSSYI